MSETGADDGLRHVVTKLGEQVSTMSEALEQLMLERGNQTHVPPNQSGPGGNNSGVIPDLQAPPNEAQIGLALEGAVTDSLRSGYNNAVRSERLLRDAGYSDDTSAQPALMALTREARAVALRMAASGVTGEDGEDEDDTVEDRGKGAQAELPPGVPDWPPRPFLARQKVFTKPWQVWLLKQGEPIRSDSDPRIAEGDCLSNVVLWLDYATISMRLLDAAVKAEDYAAVLDLVAQSSAYQAAAYEAARMRVDDISMGILNRPAAELYVKTSRMDLETTTMRAPGIRFLRKSNAAMLNAKAKAIANKAAAVPGTSNDSSQGAQSSKKKKSRGASGAQSNDNAKNTKPAPRSNDAGAKRPTGAPQPAASSAADKSGRTDAVGGQ